jgi:hypothetical protein
VTKRRTIAATGSTSSRAIAASGGGASSSRSRRTRGAPVAPASHRAWSPAGFQAWRSPRRRLVAAADRQLVDDRHRAAAEAAIVAGQGLGRQRREVEAADPAGRAGEGPRDHLGAQAQGLEDLRAAVALHRRDAHLRHDLQEAVVAGVQVAGDRRLDRAGDVAARHQVGDAVEGQVRVDRGGAVADQDRQVVDLAGLAGLDQEAGLHAGAGPDQVLLDRAQGQERRHRGPSGVDPAVGQDEDVAAVVDRRRGLGAQPVEGGGQPGGPVGDREQGRQPSGLEGALVERRDLGQGRVVEERPGQPDLVAALGRLVEGVAVGAEVGLEGHHQGLADRIDRRVGDLGEELVEVVGQGRGLGRQRGQRRVGAHRADRLLAGVGHRRDQQVDVLVAVAEGAELGEQLVAGDRGRRRRRLELVHLEHVLVEPLPVREAAGDVALELVVGDDAALVGVDHEHPPRLQAALGDDALGRQIDDPGLRRQDHAIVVGAPPPGRAQAVAVEGSADDEAVGEDHRRRAVPRLDQRRGVAIERLLVGVHRRVALPGLGDHHHHRVGQRAAAQVQELEQVVELRRVALARDDDRRQALEAAAELGRAELALARVDPADVAAQRVDLAVVGDEAKRLRQVPGRQGVGREPRVDHRDRRHHLGGPQVGVERRELVRQEQALVDDRLGRQRRDVEGAAGIEPLGADPVLGQLADHVQGPLVGRRRHPQEPDVELAEHRHDLLGGRPDGAGVDRHVAPAHHPLALGGDRGLEDALARRARGRVRRQEHLGDAVAAAARHVEAQALALGLEEAVGELERDAGAVAGLGVGAARAAVGQPGQDPERVFDDLPGLLTFDVRDEPHAAGVTLGRRIVEAGGRRHVASC